METSRTQKYRIELQTQIVFGAGVLAELPECVKELSVKSLLVVASQGGEKRHRDRLEKLLKAWHTDFITVPSSYPTIQTVDQVRAALRQKPFDAIVGVGGGSVMDTCKGLAPSPRREIPFVEILKNTHSYCSDVKPLILVPTTSGTSSEVNSWGTIWDFENPQKYVISHATLSAKFAVVDPELMLTLPPRNTAICGMDALSHAMESLWSKAVQPVTPLLAGEAIRLIFEYLPKAVSDPTNIEYRTQMAHACLLAGIAFSQTKTAAAHSMSYPLTLFHRVPHGIACSITLGKLLVANMQTSYAAVKPILDAIGVVTPEQGDKRLNALTKQIGLPVKLGELGIAEGDLDLIIQHSYSDRMHNNIRWLEPNELKLLLQSIL